MTAALRCAAAIATAAAALVAAPAAAAIPPRPADLRVAGGSDTWHADNSFALSWTTPEGGAAIAATHFRVRDPHGETIAESGFAWAGDGIDPVIVPRIPGAYSVEVWLEDEAHVEGPAATTMLRFDNARPAPIQPQSPPSWISRTAFPLRVRLGHPVGPAPISGIRGYAVAIDSLPDGAPCAAPDRCTDAETTLRGGVADDEIEIAALPEGTSYLHAVAVSGSGMKSASAGRAVLRVDTTDPLTQLIGAPPGWTNQTVSLSASATDGDSGMQADGEGPPPFTAIQVDGGAPQTSPGSHTTVSVIGEGTHRVAYYARDAAGNVDDGGERNGIGNRPPRSTWVRIDRTPPSVAFLNSQDPSDPELLRARIIDPLSGPDPASGRIGVRRAGSGDPFEPLPPLPAGDAELRARWNSDAHPAGEYEFSAVGHDLAGNAATTTRRANGAAMILTNPLKATTALRAGFRGRIRRAVPYGRGVLLRGRLTATRAPLGGVPVRIVERFAPGARVEASASTLISGPGGDFSLRLGPGPSREVVVLYEGSPTLARSASAPLHLAVRSSVRLRASSARARVGGAPVVFRGRIAAPAGQIPAGGKQVQLQFRLPGLPWAEFRTVTTDRRGRFRYAYRFSDDDSRGVRFQFRAYAPAQDGWPYEPAGSRPVIVRGR